MRTDEGSILGLWILEDEAILSHCEIDLSDFDVVFVFDLDQSVDALMHPRKGFLMSTKRPFLFAFHHIENTYLLTLL